MLSQEALEKILGIKERTLLTGEEMASRLNVTFYPKRSDIPISPDIQAFLQKLRATFEELQVNIVPYESALQVIPYQKVAKRFLSLCFNDLLYLIGRLWGTPGTTRHYISFKTMMRILRRRKIKSGISVIAIGDYAEGELPIDSVSSFRKSSVITVVEMPPGISPESAFGQHFDAAMSLFAHHMTNIVIAVRGTKWTLYNFNASHPTYDIGEHFREDVLYGLIPKIAAPIRPLRFTDMHLVKTGFDPADPSHAPYVKDMVEHSRTFAQTELYPPGKQIASLPFRSDFYRWIGALHLDHRNGMSYGFLARQLPVPLSPLISIDTACQRFGSKIAAGKDFFFDGDDLYVIVSFQGQAYCLRVPEVWVLSQRSGSDKTNMDPSRDLVKLGLRNGAIYIQSPKGLRLTSEYRPSFDTGVILSHAVGNAIIASILEHLRPGNEFSTQIRDRGAATIHWHGYLNKALIPADWVYYGENNPHVSCSSPQASLYAIVGKLDAFESRFEQGKPFLGDIHIEPHHGTNISFTSIESIAEFFVKNPKASSLGNLYLDAYLTGPKA